jgi:hypothetical protein
MSVAAIAIDNFLSDDKWSSIQSNITEYLNTSNYKDERDSLHSQINVWIEEKLRSLSLWQDSWSSQISLFSSMISRPIGQNCESSDPNNGGFHMEQGGYIYYAHPQWDSSWGGNLKFKDCDIDSLEPAPNRFVWVNPDVWHGIEVVGSNAQTSRVSVVAWPSGTVEYPDASVIINKVS